MVSELELKKMMMMRVSRNTCNHGQRKSRDRRSKKDDGKKDRICVAKRRMERRKKKSIA